MKTSLKLKQNKNQIQDKENEETKPKKEKKLNKPNTSLDPPSIPTPALLFLESIKSGTSNFSLSDTVSLKDIPLLLNQIHVSVAKMKPTEKLNYLKQIKVNKSIVEIKEKTKKMKNPIISRNIVDNYKSDIIKFKILTGLSVESFINLVDLLECQTVCFKGDLNVRNCKFQKSSFNKINEMDHRYKLDVESTVFIFLVFIRTGLDFTKMFVFFNLENVSPYRSKIEYSEKEYIKKNKSRMSKFVKGYITTFLKRYTFKIQRDFIDQISSCAEMNIPLAVGMTVNDILICPELLYSYRVIDSKTVQCTTQWIRNKDTNGNFVKTKNTDLYSEKVNASGFKYEIQINKCCFITHVVSTFGKTSDINLSKIGDAGTFNLGLTIGDSGYAQNTYHGIITPMKKNCAKTEEDKTNRNLFNSTITHSRNIIEQVFGNMSTLFGILKTNYMQDKSLFQAIIICICGLYNYYLIDGPIRNDLINNKENEKLFCGMDVNSILENNYKNVESKCDIFENLHIPQTQQFQSQFKSQSQSQKQTPSSIFGYDNGYDLPFQQMEQILLESQSQKNSLKNTNEMKSTNNNIDVDEYENSEKQIRDIYSAKNEIPISKEEMLQLKNGDFIESVIVNYILRKTIYNKDIYLFETLEPEMISKEIESSIRNIYQRAAMYPIWFVPFNDEHHFTLFIVHNIHKNISFEQSCVLYFDSLPSFQSDYRGHIDIIKRISNCIGSRFNEIIHKINVPQQSNCDCGCCVCYFAEKYCMNMPNSVEQTNSLFSEKNIKSEMDNYRKYMVLSIEEDRLFNN